MLLENFFQDNKDEMTGALIKFSGDSGAAEDAVQECFLKALNRRKQLEQMPEPAMKAWLYVTARNSLIDIKRKSSRMTELTDDIALGKADDVESTLIIRSMLDRLPNDLKNIVSLKYYADMNATEISSMMGIPSATIRTRLRKAMLLMREYLNG